MSATIYFDNNATTVPDRRVVEAMLDWLGPSHGNPSSVHGPGQRARGAVEEARRRVAGLLGADPLEVVFLASGTEANNQVLRSIFGGNAAGHLVLSTLEHPSIAETAKWLEGHGVAVTHVAPGPEGIVAVDAVVEALRDDTRLVALMLANNELGTIQPVAEVAAACRERSVPVLCDAVQAIGKIPVDFAGLGVDFLSLAGHKFHGPLGAAALCVRSGREIEPLLFGGGQERRRRPGTENVAALVGLGVACDLASSELEERGDHLRTLRERFEAGLARLEGCRVHCGDAPRLPHTSHVAFEGVAADELVIRLDLAGYAVSTGAACASGAVAASPALLSMGLEADEARSSLRVSFGMANTLEEVDGFLPVLEREVTTLRARRGAALPIDAGEPS
jgi:cysteine desulfurase